MGCKGALRGQIEGVCDTKNSPVKEWELIFGVLGIHEILCIENRPKDGQIKNDDDKHKDEVSRDNPPSFFVRVMQFAVSGDARSLQRVLGVPEELWAILLDVLEAASAPLQCDAPGLLFPSLLVRGSPCDDEDEESDHVPVHLALGIVPAPVLHQPHHDAAEHRGNHLVD